MPIQVMSCAVAAVAGTFCTNLCCGTRLGHSCSPKTLGVVQVLEEAQSAKCCCGSNVGTNFGEMTLCHLFGTRFLSAVPHGRLESGSRFGGVIPHFLNRMRSITWCRDGPRLVPETLGRMAVLPRGHCRSVVDTLTDCTKTVRTFFGQSNFEIGRSASSSLV